MDKEHWSNLCRKVKSLLQPAQNKKLKCSNKVCPNWGRRGSNRLKTGVSSYQQNIFLVYLLSVNETFLFASTKQYFKHVSMVCQFNLQLCKQKIISSIFSPPVQISLVLPSRLACRRVPLHHPMTGSLRGHIHQWQKLQGTWTWWVWWQTLLPQGCHHLGRVFDQSHSKKNKNTEQWLNKKKWLRWENSNKVNWNMITWQVWIILLLRLAVTPWETLPDSKTTLNGVCWRENTERW